MYCLFIWNVYCIFRYIRYHTWYNELCSYKSICFSLFSYLLYCVFALTLNFIKNIPNVDFMVILFKFATCHVRNAFKRPLCPNAPTVRVLTSVILKGIGWAFRKLYPSKIPGMVHQGLLAPEGLLARLSKYSNTQFSKRTVLPPNLSTVNVTYNQNISQERPWRCG